MSFYTWSAETCRHVELEVMWLILGAVVVLVTASSAVPPEPGCAVRCVAAVGTWYTDIFTRTRLGHWFHRQAFARGAFVVLYTVLHAAQQRVGVVRCYSRSSLAQQAIGTR